MTASSGRRADPGSRGVLHAFVSAAREFLLDPAEPAAGIRAADLSARPVIAVFGLGCRCGSTVVARGVAAELAARDPGGSAAVAGEAESTRLSLATQPAARLARALADLPGGARALGRLCLLRAGDPSALADALRGLAPLVIDAGSTALGGVPARVADRTVLVTTPRMEPALARVAADCVARVGPEPALVLNRVRDRGDAGGDQPGGAPGGASFLELPESRLGAGRALAGRGARGGLGRAIAALTDTWEGVRAP